ncbi:hypothetical protein Q6293_29475, partial [Klebsiella pneumoniae]|uniref:hypothetical protein n=1 Tax=Klebsiella pneumoniae TaxID=573 RepID=UPI0027316A02
SRKPPRTAACSAYLQLNARCTWVDQVLIENFKALEALQFDAIMTCCTALIGDYYDGRERVQLLSWQTIVTSLSATAFF